MADVRALLKAKRQEARINHPLASYNQTGQLRCTVCGTIVKHTSAWEGHLGSKSHRTNVAKLREEERKREERRILEEQQEQERILEQERIARGKRKAVSLEEEEVEDLGDDMEDAEEPMKKRRINGPSDGGFPADFFSDTSRKLVDSMDVDEEDADETAQPPQPATATTAPASSELDLEWERFQRDVVNAADHRDTYENATVMAEPVLASEVPEGFPTREPEEQAEEPEQVDEEQLRREKEQEERELIMDRLMDEERAQEDADMKVTVMKNKLEALRKKREAAKAAKANPPAS